jgi:hypothetical protein
VQNKLENCNIFSAWKTENAGLGNKEKSFSYRGKTF